ncbi:MAG: D-alanyl-D-alanine carboxypeptidase [Lachnospiraceae bacterium]|nr:D-alanyl-D-alanine carboxypeptidase [Lachnospiraceae bacterium]
MSTAVPAFADEVTREDINASRMAMPASSNSIPGWPQASGICAESAVLMDADTGTILYDKNMDTIHFPASTTKIMTCLLAAENCSMDETVTFSKEAVFGIDRGSSNVGMDVGESITMEEAIYCVMLASANEVAAAIAEHISGSTEEFAKLMNKRAAELGCTNTHFMNANGLPNDEHWTTAHDLALIARAFNSNETCVRIASTSRYEVKATATQPDTFLMPNHHNMYPGKEYAYDGVVWGKTGYTNVARSTLVTTAERNGMNLICVIMKDEPPAQYTDTATLFDYGFDNFQKLNVADNESGFSIDNSDFFDTDADIFGSSKAMLGLDPNGSVIIPNTASFSDLTYTINYEPESKDAIADINYTYGDVYVGKTSLILTSSDAKTFSFGTASIEGNNEPVARSASANSVSANKIIYINVKYIWIGGFVLGALILIIVILWLIFRHNHYSNRRRKNILKRNKRYSSEFDDFDFK